MIGLIPYPAKVEMRSGVLKFSGKPFSVGVSGAFAAEALSLSRELFIRFTADVRMDTAVGGPGFRGVQGASARVVCGL